MDYGFGWCGILMVVLVWFIVSVLTHPDAWDYGGEYERPPVGKHLPSEESVAWQSIWFNQNE